MHPVDYWPMTREYSIWNATTAALQFLTADLKAHMLSNAIEQVYNTFFYSTSMHLLSQQSDEILFSHFMTTLNTAFESKLALEDKGYDSGNKVSTYPHHLEEPPRFTTFPVSRMCPLTLTQSHHAALLPKSHTADWYADA